MVTVYVKLFAGLGNMFPDLQPGEALEVPLPAQSTVEQLAEKRIDLITFTSSSTARNFKALLPPDKFKDLIDGVAIASIGPITTETAEALGFEVHITAENYTIPGLFDAILQYFNKTT